MSINHKRALRYIDRMALRGLKKKGAIGKLTDRLWINNDVEYRPFFVGLQEWGESFMDFEKVIKWLEIENDQQ